MDKPYTLHTTVSITSCTPFFNKELKKVVNLVTYVVRLFIKTAKTNNDFVLLDSVSYKTEVAFGYNGFAKQLYKPNLIEVNSVLAQIMASETHSQESTQEICKQLSEQFNTHFELLDIIHLVRTVRNAVASAENFFPNDLDFSDPEHYTYSVNSDDGLIGDIEFAEVEKLLLTDPLADIEIYSRMLPF